MIKSSQAKSLHSYVLVPLYLHSLYSTNVTIFYLVIHSYSSRAMSLGNIFYMLQYSCTFLHREYASLFFCYISHGLATHAASLFLLLYLSTSRFGYSYLQCPVLLYLKHCTFFSSIFCLLTFASFFTLYLITLLVNISNLLCRDIPCHKLHSAISPPILQRFSRSQWLRKALEKTFQSIPVTPRSDQ